MDSAALTALLADGWVPVRETAWGDVLVVLLEKDDPGPERSDPMLAPGFLDKPIELA